MKALSLHPEWAMLVLIGDKTVECRTWKTAYRGDILICSTAHKIEDTIPSHALCVATLVDVIPFAKKHLKRSCLDKMPSVDCFAWELENIRLIKPFPVKGQQRLWECDKPIKFLKAISFDELSDDEWDRLYGSIIY